MGNSQKKSIKKIFSKSNTKTKYKIFKKKKGKEIEKEEEKKIEFFEEDNNFEENAEQIQNYIFSDCEAPPVFTDYNVPKCKTFEPSLNISLMNAPKQKLKIFNEKITPLVLYSKTFGAKLNKKKPNSIIVDFQKEIIDSKSCNDSINLNDELFDGFDSDFETGQNSDFEEIKNISNCRKKMAIFRDSIDNKSEHSFDENDKIEYIFSENKEQNKENKKKNFWSKHIEQQKIIQNRISNKFRISTNFFQKAETVKNQDINDNGLFILGVLESAAKEKKMKKKMRYTSNV